jgi:hypothetical protein
MSTTVTITVPQSTIHLVWDLLNREATALREDGVGLFDADEDAAAYSEFAEALTPHVPAEAVAQHQAVTDLIDARRAARSS